MLSKKYVGEEVVLAPKVILARVVFYVTELLLEAKNCN